MIMAYEAIAVFCNQPMLCRADKIPEILQVLVAETELNFDQWNTKATMVNLDQSNVLNNSNSFVILEYLHFCESVIKYKFSRT